MDSRLVLLAALTLLALYLLVLGVHECFVDTEFTNVTRPDINNGAWRSKIDAQAPIGGDDEAYIKSLQAFYDTVYVPSPTKPTTKDVESFLAGPNVVGKPIDTQAMRLILVDAFHIESTETAAAKEKKQIQFEINPADLEPANGRDEVRVRSEANYFPADPVFGKLPEGNYAPVNQQKEPRHPGFNNYKTIGKSPVLFYDVCTDSKRPGCEENVL
jgi:hypothetical protein